MDIHIDPVYAPVHVAVLETRDGETIAVTDLAYLLSEGLISMAEVRTSRRYAVWVRGDTTLESIDLARRAAIAKDRARGGKE